MKALQPEQLAFLERYGFDRELFDSFRTAVKKKKLSLDHNVIEGSLHAPDAGEVHGLPTNSDAEVAELSAIGKAAIGAGEFGVVILNGGMATRFGGVVKGVVDVIGERSFLALKLEDVARAEQECGGRIPVFLMNSFATDEATAAHLEQHNYFGLPSAQVRGYTQFISVRMLPNGDIFETKNGEISPYGPGHGDCIPALRAHGCLADFLAGGGKHLFVANVDNLGARVSPLVLGHHIRSEQQATVELAPKWPGDVGGAPYVVDDQLQLVEQLRFPADFDPDIVDVFNTNTFHFDAKALDREFDLGWYYVRKKVEGRDAVQIERLIGEMTKFLSSNYVKVKRTGPDNRFFPVKTPDDLEAGREEIGELYA